MSGGATVMFRARQHEDRWSDFESTTGLAKLSSMLLPSQLAEFDVFEGLAREFLADLSPDVSLAEWEVGTVLF